MSRTITYSLADLFESVAAAVPEREAIVCGNRRLTFAQLDDRANRLAAYFQSMGVGAGDTVGLQLYNGSEYLEGYLAACKLRAIPLNINYRYVANELRYIYDNAKLAVLMYSAPLAVEVTSVLPDYPGIKAVLVPGADYEAVLEESGSGYVVPQRSGEDLSLLYTGGTTGMPKGVMWPHQSLFFSALGGGGFYRKEGPVKSPEELAEVAKAAPPLRYMAIAPLMHSAALWASLASLFNGLAVIMRDEVEFDAPKIWYLAEREKANIISVVGDALAVPLVDALKANPGRWNLSAVINIGSGGGLFSSHVQQELRQLLPNVVVNDSIGSSESGSLGSGSKPENGEGFIKLAPRQDLQVLALTRDRFVGPGEEGVLVRVGNVAVGYWGDPQKTADIFTTLNGQRIVITGDMAKVLDDGSIVVLGRGSQCINTGGEKVFPEEVEEILHRHEAVADALVVGVPDSRWGSKVVAVLSVRAGVRVEQGELEDYCRHYLAGYKVPKAIVIVDEVMRSPAGKANYRWAKETAEAYLKSDTRD